MKTIGLIGGMSWESTAEYYRIINEEIKSRLGGLHSAKCLINSVDFEEIEGFQSSGDWDKCRRNSRECSIFITNGRRRLYYYLHKYNA